MKIPPPGTHAGCIAAGRQSAQNRYIDGLAQKNDINSSGEEGSCCFFALNH